MTGHLQTSPMVVTAISSSRQLWGQSPLSLELNVTGFDRFEFKFRPKRSDFCRKKLRTAETAVGFRLSEVALSPGRRGGKLGGLQQALRRTPVFYPYRADSQSGPSPLGVALFHPARAGAAAARQGRKDGDFEVKLKLILAAGLLTTLSACGGGGGLFD